MRVNIICRIRDQRGSVTESRDNSPNDVEGTRRKLRNRVTVSGDVSHHVRLTFVGTSTRFRELQDVSPSSRVAARHALCERVRIVQRKIVFQVGDQDAIGLSSERSGDAISGLGAPGRLTE